MQIHLISILKTLPKCQASIGISIGALTSQVGMFVFFGVKVSNTQRNIRVQLFEFFLFLLFYIRVVG